MVFVGGTVRVWLDRGSVLGSASACLSLNFYPTFQLFFPYQFRGGDSYQKWGGGGGGGANNTIARCRRQCIEVRSADQSARSGEIFFTFIFLLSGWALVASSCFVLQVRDASPQETR